MKSDSLRKRGGLRPFLDLLRPALPCHAAGVVSAPASLAVGGRSVWMHERPAEAARRIEQMIATLLSIVVTAAQCTCIVMFYHTRVALQSAWVQSDVAVFVIPTVIGFAAHVLIYRFRRPFSDGARWSMMQCVGAAFALTGLAFVIALFIALNIWGG